jgi:integrase
MAKFYSDQEIELFMSGCDARQKAVYSVMLQSLFREREVVFLCWADVDPQRSELRVTAKPLYAFKPKKAHECSVKIPREPNDRHSRAAPEERRVAKDSSGFFIPRRKRSPNRKIPSASQVRNTGDCLACASDYLKQQKGALPIHSRRVLFEASLGSHFFDSC